MPEIRQPHRSTRDAAGEAAVRAALEQISRAWQAHRTEQLADLFHERMVLVPPGFQGRLDGRAPIIASYKEFMDRVNVTKYVERVATIDVWHDTAVADVEWEMTWDESGTSSSAKGHDVFVFAREEGRWLATWRLVSETVPPA